MESFERARLDAYFAKIAAQFAPTEQAASFLVTHLLPERPGFVRAVASLSRLRAVLPKPKSISPSAQREVAELPGRRTDPRTVRRDRHRAGLLRVPGRRRAGRTAGRRRLLRPDSHRPPRTLLRPDRPG